MSLLPCDLATKRVICGGGGRGRGHLGLCSNVVLLWHPSDGFGDYSIPAVKKKKLKKNI